MPFDPQIYRLASIAREKLCREAARASHDLRLLVAHATMLDELLNELNAPGGLTTEYYGFDLQPQDVPTERAARMKVVGSVDELSEQELEDEESLKQSHNSNSGSSPASLPMLSHDSESDSDSDSASDSASDSDESDDSDDFSIISPSTSPTDTSSSMSSVEEPVESDEADLGLRRSKSAWRLFRGFVPAFKVPQKRTETKSMNDAANDFEQPKLTPV